MLAEPAYEDEVSDNKYRPGQRINVSMWDVIEKEFRDRGQERKLRKLPGDKKRSSGDKKGDRKWKEFQEFQAAQARALVPIGECTTPERPRSPYTPGKDAMGDVHMGTPEAHPAPATSSSSALAASSSSTAAASSSSPAREPTTRSARSIPNVEECRKRAEECERCTGRPCHLRERQRLLVEHREQRKRWTVKEMTERQRGMEAWRRGIGEILAQEVAQRAEALKAEMVREIEEQEAEKEEAKQAARMAAARRAEREQEVDASHHLDVELLKRPLRGEAEEYGRGFPSASNPPATASEDNMTHDDIQVKSGSTVSDERSKGKNKGKNKTKMRAKPQQSEEEYYTTCGDQDFSDFRGRAEVIVSDVAAGGQPPSDPSSDGSSSDSTGGRPGGSPPRRLRSHSDESDDSVRIPVLPGHPRAGRLDREQLHDRRSQDFIDWWSAIDWLKGRVEELEKVTKKLDKEAAIAKQEVVRLTGVVGEAQKTATQAVEESKRHAQVATSLQDRLDARTSERLEECGEVREARPQAPPRRGDVEPTAP